MSNDAIIGPPGYAGPGFIRSIKGLASIAIESLSEPSNSSTSDNFFSSKPVCFEFLDFKTSLAWTKNEVNSSPL